GVTKLDAFDVIGSAADTGGGVGNLIWRDVDELRVRLNEAADEPRTGNAIDLGMFARHPLVLGRVALASRRQSQFFPAADAAFEIYGFHADPAQRCGHTLTDLASMIAIGDDRSAGRKLLSPALHLFGRPIQSTDDQSVIVAKGILPTNIHQERRRGRPEVQVKLLR